MLNTNNRYGCFIYRSGIFSLVQLPFAQDEWLWFETFALPSAGISCTL